MPACPICDQPTTPASSPFCSPRCKLVDLSRWLSETYTIPATPTEADLDALLEGEPEDDGPARAQAARRRPNPDAH
jgi:endogenous inhibitor of DNA gyrase (YacG/DUF329 family)